MRIQVEISPGELFDKITILEIKLSRIEDEEKLAHIERELATLTESGNRVQQSLEGNRQHDKLKELGQLIAVLKGLNERIWVIEDDIRDRERQGDFGEGFIGTARSVYQTNDKRASAKRRINALLGSDIAEQKSYTEYKTSDSKQGRLFDEPIT
jgi:hypothetical protein